MTRNTIFITACLLMNASIYASSDNSSNITLNDQKKVELHVSEVIKRTRDMTNLISIIGTIDKTLLTDGRVCDKKNQELQKLLKKTLEKEINALTYQYIQGVHAYNKSQQEITELKLVVAKLIKASSIDPLEDFATICGDSTPNTPLSTELTTQNHNLNRISISPESSPINRSNSDRSLIRNIKRLSDFSDKPKNQIIQEPRRSKRPLVQVDYKTLAGLVFNDEILAKELLPAYKTKRTEI